MELKVLYSLILEKEASWILKNPFNGIESEVLAADTEGYSDANPFNGIESLHNPVNNISSFEPTESIQWN